MIKKESEKAFVAEHQQEINPKKSHVASAAFESKSRKSMRAAIVPHGPKEAKNILDGKTRVANQNDEYFQIIADAVSDVVVLIDQDFIIKHASSSCMRVLGYQPAAFIGRRLTSHLVHPDDRSVVKGVVSEAVAKRQTSAKITYRYMHAAGHYLWLETVANAAESNNGKPLHFVVSSRNVTDQRNAEIALQDKHTKYRQLFEMESDAIFLIDNNTGDIIDVNPAACSLYGYTHEEFLQMKHTHVSAEQIDTRRATMTKQEWVPVRYHRKKNGTVFPVEITASQFIWQGRAVHIATIRDITARLAMQEALKVSEQKYRTLYESAGDAIFISKLKERIVDCNKKATEIFGVDRRMFMGKGAVEVSPPLQEDGVSSRQKAIALTKRALSGETPHFTWQCLKGDGTLFDVECTLSHFKVNKEPFIITIVRDISERKLTEKKLAETVGLLRKSIGALIQALNRVVEARDPYTAGHQKRVSNLARAIAAKLGLPSDTIEGIRIAGAVHDIGKIWVPAEILSKPGRLSLVEFEVVKVHAQAGYDILKEIDFSWPVAEIVLQHHERNNGSGYPRGLQRSEISIEAKVLAVADVVEAILSHRPYRPSAGLEVALEAINQGKGTLYEENVVKACIELLKEDDDYIL